ncbi:hypothetical protein PSP6_410024 [Paraburkholderia tropica]|nr:hypothetical protein PSP6_410024 [Paraburkholderia tropica]
MSTAMPVCADCTRWRRSRVTGAALVSLSTFVFEADEAGADEAGAARDALRRAGALAAETAGVDVAVFFIRRF